MNCYVRNRLFAGGERKHVIRNDADSRSLDDSEVRRLSGVRVHQLRQHLAYPAMSDRSIPKTLQNVLSAEFSFLYESFNIN